jgi:hypothetical protein
VLFLATPSSPPAREAMRAGRIGCMTTPAQGNRIPPGCMYACDNGKFGKGWPGADAWFRWLMRKVSRYGPERCLWAVAPDVPFDAAGTLAESAPWLRKIRALKIPAAFAAQDGSERRGMIPWADLGPNGVLFVAGSTDWKLSTAAADLVADARARGLTAHMGRVNTRDRLRHAAAIDCATCDGTTVAKYPKTFHQLERWLDEVHADPPRVEYSLFGQPAPQAGARSRRARALAHATGGEPAGATARIDTLPLWEVTR